jgi:flagella basal body P-ring formation protein FlgA
MTLPALLLAACLPLAADADRITAADLAKAQPAFAAVPADTVLAYAPSPGTPRVFTPAELAHLARRFAVPAIDPAAAICYERPTGPLDPERLLDAMRAALAMPDARVEMVEASRYPAPQGRIEFSRAALPKLYSAQPDAPVLWQGSVAFGSRGHFPIWARVRIRVRLNCVLAAKALASGHVIQPGEVRLDTVEIFPASEPPLTALDQAVGRVPRRAIRAGVPISAAILDAPYDVARGDSVRVAVDSGEAHLELNGLAEAAGRRGDIISVRNPENGRRFRARVVSPGNVAAGVKP